ncbi:hypothetical protein TNCV_3766011 [Trichonephila clavipes]|nr:hypothetical protein TNCV_3766011 [Trichonephila clavipes]
MRSFLKDRFEQQIIAYEDTVEGPSRLPGLIRLDFFLWGYIKDQVYAHTSLLDLRCRLTDGCNKSRCSGGDSMVTRGTKSGLLIMESIPNKWYCQQNGWPRPPVQALYLEFSPNYMRVAKRKMEKLNKKNDFIGNQKKSTGGRNTDSIVSAAGPCLHSRKNVVDSCKNPAQLPSLHRPNRNVILS